MTRDELLKAFVALKSAKAAGVISDSEFTQKLAAMKYTSQAGNCYVIDAKKGAFVRAPAEGQAAAGTGQQQLPEKFVPLLAVIVRKTIATFIRRLPITLIFGAAAMLAHSYYVVVVNEGFNIGSNSPNAWLLNLNDNFVSSTTVWMIFSMVIMAVLIRLNPFGRKKKRVSLFAKIEAVASYLLHKKLDALAVIAAGVGLTLVIGALVSGSANITLAIGVGALFASRAGSVVALLARSAWNTSFSTFRGDTAQKHGMAIGYVTLFATSIGFLLNSSIAPNGVSLGILLLVGALGYSLLQRFGLSGINSFFLLLVFGGVAATIMGYPIMAIADDGGWAEVVGKNKPMSPENIIKYLQGGGSIEALLIGLPAGVSAGIGAALAQALNALGIDFDVDLEMDSGGGSDPDRNTRILEGDAAHDWLVRNGYYDEKGPTVKYTNWQNETDTSPNRSNLGGVVEGDDGSLVIITTGGAPLDSAEQGSEPKGSDQPDAKQKEFINPYEGKPFETDGKGNYWGPDQNGDWRWLSEDEARESSAALQAEVDKKEDAFRDFNKETDRLTEQRNADRERKLREDHYIYDEDQQAWVKDPDYVPPRTKQEEFYDRVNYLDEHKHELSDDRKEAIDRILDRMGYGDDIVDPKNLSDKTMDDIDRLTKATNTIINSENEGKAARDWSRQAGHYETLGTPIRDAGKVSASTLEKYYLHDKTKGAITEFVFSIAGNHDMDFWDNMEKSGLSSGKTALGNLTGDLSQSAGWRMFNNAAWAGGEEIYKGSDAETILTAAIKNMGAGEIKQFLGERIKIEKMIEGVQDEVRRAMLESRLAKLEVFQKILDRELAKGSIKL